MVGKSVLTIAVLFSVAMFSASPASALQTRIVDDGDRVTLQGNVHPLARPEYNVGTTDFSLPMERMILSLKLTPARQAALDKLIADQQDPASPHYHRWLTPGEFGEQFGPPSADVAVITDWLSSHGFIIDEVAKSRTWINFSGTVADVERAFRTTIHDFSVNGHLRHANATAPSIPRGLTDLVSGVVSLHNFPRKAMNIVRPLSQGDLQPDDTSGGSHYLSPGDFATSYNVNALYNAGVDGTGVTIAIVGRTHPSSSNWTTFRSLMALPATPPVVTINGTDPGDQGADEDGEADLDVEWSGAVAKKATINFVVSKSTNTTDGVDLSAQYIVNNNLAPVMSTSFGSCEADMGSAENAFYNSLWQQAAAQGITSFISTGDSGAAGCNSGSDSSGSGLGVNGLASTPYNVAVGGTQFNEGSDTYWNTTNGAGYSSILGYIPEAAWNESGAAGAGCPPGETCSQLWSTGGGASMLYTKPSWQVSPGVPAANNRHVPDVSLSAAIHDGYLVQTQGALYIFGGTSASSPSFAGIMALIVQSTGQRQGNANIRFYQLANAQYGSGGTAVFHDITTGNNSVPGVTGYPGTVGYDLATGLGSVDAYALAANWTGAMTVPGAPTIGTTTAGVNQATVTFTAPSSSGGRPIILYTVTSSPGGITATGTSSPVTVTGLTNGTAYTFTVTATNSVGTGAASSPSNSVTPFRPIIINGDALYTKKAAVPLALTYPGATAMQFSTNGTTWTSWGTYAAAKSLTLPSGNGLKTVAVRFRNSSGTVSDAYQATITLDTTAPANGTLTITPATNAFNLQWQGFSDALSGLAGYRLVRGTLLYPSCTATPLYSGTNASYTDGSVVSGKSYYYRVCALDNAGNVSTGATAKLKAP